MVSTRRQSLAGDEPVKVPTADAFGGKYKRQPVEIPTFTLGQLRKAIPAHCFKRSAWRSASYLVTDLIMIAAMLYASTFIDNAPVAAPVRWAMWAMYWFLQGAVMTGVWVIAHECGHQAFSESQAINDGVGLIFHSLLLVPYYSWKHSHRRHHSNCNSVTQDEVFVPDVLDQASEAFDIAQLLPVRVFWLVTTLLIGWPLYLLFNVASRPYPKETWVSHFNPWSPIFSKRERVEVAVSDAALVAVGYGLVQVGKAFGWAWLVKTYGVPYLIVNFWLVTITLLQHNHASLPHFTENEWDWLRGALATVDRNYGWLLNTLHHHIADTHVTHHLFSTMPHYHAQEATEAIKPILGKYYQYDDRFILKGLWQDWAYCRYVAPDNPGDGVLWQRF